MIRRPHVDKWSVIKRINSSNNNNCGPDGNKIPTSIPMFSGPGNTTRLLRGLLYVRVRGKCTSISNAIQDGNETPLAIPMFLGSTLKTWV